MRKTSTNLIKLSLAAIHKVVLSSNSIREAAIQLNTTEDALNLYLRIVIYEGIPLNFFRLKQICTTTMKAAYSNYDQGGIPKPVSIKETVNKCLTETQLTLPRLQQYECNPENTLKTDFQHTFHNKHPLLTNSATSSSDIQNYQSKTTVYSKSEDTYNSRLSGIKSKQKVCLVSDVKPFSSSTHSLSFFKQPTSVMLRQPITSNGTNSVAESSQETPTRDTKLTQITPIIAHTSISEKSITSKTPGKVWVLTNEPSKKYEGTLSYLIEDTIKNERHAIATINGISCAIKEVTVTSWIQSQLILLCLHTNIRFWHPIKLEEQLVIAQNRFGHNIYQINFNGNDFFIEYLSYKDLPSRFSQIWLDSKGENVLLSSSQINVNQITYQHSENQIQVNYRLMKPEGSILLRLKSLDECSIRFTNISQSYTSNNLNSPIFASTSITNRPSKKHEINDDDEILSTQSLAKKLRLSPKI